MPPSGLCFVIFYACIVMFLSFFVKSSNAGVIQGGHSNNVLEVVPSTTVRGFQEIKEVRTGRENTLNGTEDKTEIRFTRDCSQQTSQEVVHVSNHKYPGQFPNVASTDLTRLLYCNSLIIRKKNNYCGLRIELSIDDKAGKRSSEICIDSLLPAVKLGDKFDLALCNQGILLKKNSYDFDISGASDLKLNFSSLDRARLIPFDVEITQIKCDEFAGEDLEGVIFTGGGSGDEGSKFVVNFGEEILGAGISDDGGDAIADGVSAHGELLPSLLVLTNSSSESLPPPQESPFPVEDPPKPPSPYMAMCGIKGPDKQKERKEKILHAIEDLEDAASNLKDILQSDSQEDHSGKRLEHLHPRVNDSSKNGSKLSRSVSKRSHLATRSTHGVETWAGEFPWQVALFEVNDHFHCGASIIGDFYILTAGHCVYDYQMYPYLLVLRLGEWSLFGNSDGAYTIAHIAKITVHPEFSNIELQNDIAVLKLDRRIDFNEKISPVCLPESDIPLAGKMATITGWGLNEYGTIVDKMNKLTAVILDNNECRSKWNDSDAINQSVMCMDSNNGDSCNGDSGGPSVIEHPANSGKFFQVGIVSYGSGSCTDKNLPGVYTRVGNFRDWIIRQMI